MPPEQWSGSELMFLFLNLISILKVNDMKKIIILLMLIFLIMSDFIMTQDLIPSGLRKCTVFGLKYENGILDNNSKEIFKIISYCENGYKLEEKFFWQGELSNTNSYLYDSINNLVEKKSIRGNEFYDYTLKYIYDSSGNNIIIYEHTNDGRISGHQVIEYDINGKEIEHKYFGHDDSINVIETYTYNEQGFLATKKMSSFRFKIMEIIEHYLYDSDNLLIETNIERIPELVSRRDAEYWQKVENGYVLNISIPLPPFDSKINLFYDTNKRLSKKITYSNQHAAIGITEYFYDEFGFLQKEIFSFDYSPIKELYKSQNLEYLFEQHYPNHFTGKSGEPKQEFIYNYSN